MVYTGRFKDINDVGYFIKITTDDEDTTTKELILGTPPITVSYESGESILYKPIKYSSATITVATENIYSNMYSGKNQGTKIIFTNSQRTLWSGYIIPNVYNQTYSGVIENLEIECIDALSTLKNIDYNTINENKNIVSFIEIFCHILKKCNAYSNLYIINEVIDKDLSSLYISENNFFDEDDEPMKCSEVLEEILKYLNMTIFADGINVYIIDYDAISKDYNNYIAYNINDGTLQGTHKIGGMKTINGDSFMGGDGDLSIDNVYNKASVVAELYTVDDVVPPFDDEKFLENMNGEWGNIGRQTNLTEGESEFKKYIYYRFCKHKYITHYSYFLPEYSDGSVNVGNVITTNDYPDYWGGVANSSLKNYLFAPIVQHYTSEYEAKYYNSIIGYQTYAYPEDEINFNTDLLLVCNDFGSWYRPLSQEAWDNGVRLKLLTIKPFDKNIIVNTGSIVINMQANFTDNPFYIDTPDESATSESKCQKLPTIPYLITVGGKANKITINDDYTTQSEWVDIQNEKEVDLINEFEFFCEYRDGKLTTEGLDEWSNYRVNYLNKDLSLHTYRPIHKYGYDSLGNYGEQQIINTSAVEGKIINLPNGCNLKDVEIHIYLPKNPNYDNALTGVWLKNFSVKFYQHPEDLAVKVDDEEEETNTKYENVINDEWVEELNEITMKVCTFDNKKYNYSAVYSKDENDNYIFIDTIENKALAQKLRQEEMLIYRIVQQYKKPHYKLNFQLINDFAMYNKIIYPSQEENKNFVIDTMTIDYESNLSQITLIEKA